MQAVSASFLGLPSPADACRGRGSPAVLAFGLFAHTPFCYPGLTMRIVLPRSSLAVRSGTGAPRRRCVSEKPRQTWRH